MASIHVGAIVWTKAWVHMQTLLRANMLTAQVASGGPEAGQPVGSAGEALTHFRDDTEDIAQLVDGMVDVSGGLVFTVAAGLILGAADAVAAAVLLVPLAGVVLVTRALDGRIKAEFPAHLHGLLQEGVRRLVDYQDGDYAALYLDRLRGIREGASYALTAAVARHLALWMSYEDTIRVADLKTRGSRFNRVRDEVRATAEQVVYMTEFMHPRFEEVCETLPAGMGARLYASIRARRWFAPLFRKGRQVQTAHVGGVGGLHQAQQPLLLLRRQLGEQVGRVVGVHGLQDVGRALGVQLAQQVGLVVLGELLQDVGEALVVEGVDHLGAPLGRQVAQRVGHLDGALPLELVQQLRHALVRHRQA